MPFQLVFQVALVGIVFHTMTRQLVFQLVLHVSFNSTSRVLVVLGLTCYAMARRLLLLGIMFHMIAWVGFSPGFLPITFSVMPRQLTLLGMYFTIRE